MKKGLGMLGLFLLFRCAQREKRNQVTPSASMRESARARRVATGDMPSLCLS